MRRLFPTPGAARATAVGAALIMAGAALAAAVPAEADTVADGRHRMDYVALGDSYASAPLVPDQVDPACLRSTTTTRPWWPGRRPRH